MRALRHPLFALLAAVLLIAGACGDDDTDSSAEVPEDPTTTIGAQDLGDDDDSSAEVPEGPTITIGAQDFGESAILAELYGQALENAGYPVAQQSLGGFRDVVYTSFESGDINFTAEYAASALEFLNGGAGEASGDIEPTAEALSAQLDDLGLVALDPSPAVNSNSFVVTQETADELGLGAISDLTDDLRLGGPPDCTENASCIPGLQSVYGIDLSGRFTPLDGGGPLTVAALEGDEIDVAILFSTDGTIADKGWVVLEDDMGLINADNIVPVTTTAVIEAYGDDFVSLVDRVSAALDTSGLAELNRLVAIELGDADAVAADWLADNGFS